MAYNSVMRDWLGRYKYRGNERYAPLLGLMLEKAYQMLKVQHEDAVYQNAFIRPRSAFPFRRSTSTVSWKADLLVPVPVSEPRLVERGFNQAERLAAELSWRTGIPVLPLLVRTHHTDKQSFKGRAERLTNMKHAFGPNTSIIENYSNWLMEITDALSLPAVSIDSAVHDTKHTRPVRIIIVDDIYTTGSTIRACADSVRQMTEACSFSSDIYSLTWARS
ncbi:ComF family protein [Paenibacillus wynnii]|uniref:ComF family protein n=1 Tax=Paenibacillus wynnii TaxID=268407 RepID=UPI002793E7FB|nr:ComF family protein [Paenibacillus wynnii]MDQ0192191.1 putative amidophosphoribosyltransferase [Paenibacillus wynnii]